MADQKKSFPMLPVGAWWTIRKKFKQSIPGVVTDNYIATVLAMRVESARGNILPYLKDLKIIDEEGRTGERARLWRDDGHYPEICKAIASEIYPEDLLQAVPDPTTDRASAERWFANHTGLGEVAARRMASLYTIIMEADASKEPDTEKKKERPASGDDSSRRSTPRAVARPERDRVKEGAPITHIEQPPRSKEPPAPGININLQVHISADATPDQIDQIFASMAKHLYPRD
ncbi:MAG TPA: hypothetical protein VGS27_14485 [Candidatus Sulfotelmatobacter sp.]|nr:hypothetical protein [Candidatus Sulfotelmatobacter sp.]HEV2470736.1 hypothetical protein [Candidatus Sulfotelmatobacter sp.]